MVNSIQKYKSRIKGYGDNHYDRTLLRKSRGFETYFKNALNKEECEIDGNSAFAVFQDHSQSNNKDLSDDKYVILPNSTVCNVGSYIVWRESKWLVFTEEFKTIPTHQQLKIKEVNEEIRWIDDSGKIVNNGNGWGAYVQNQTLYTLGVSFTGNNIAVVNAKMMMYMQDNEQTKTLKVQDRVFIGDNVYNVMFMDNVSRKGLINYLLEQDTISETYDNTELRIADYYRKKKDDQEKEDTSGEEIAIIGDEKLRIGRTYVFKSSKDDQVEEWIIESLGSTTSPFTIQEKDSTTMTLRVKDDARLVGTIANLIVKTKNSGIVSKNLKIISRF